MSVLGRSTVWMLKKCDCSTLPGDRLEAVTLPESVTEIGSGAFRGCKSLKRIVIPDSVTVIEAETFYGCEALREVGMGFKMF